MSKALGEDGYLHLRHNKTLLIAHLIFVTKFRHKLYRQNVWDSIKELIHEMAERMHVVIMVMESDIDHIHLLIRYDPTLSIYSIASRLKQFTTYHLWQKCPDYLINFYWEERTLWNEGYFACSVGNASKETIEEYIRNQG